MIYAGLPSFLGLELEDGHVPTFWLLMYYKPTMARPIGLMATGRSTPGSPAVVGTRSRLSVAVVNRRPNSQAKTHDAPELRSPTLAAQLTT